MQIRRFYCVASQHKEKYYQQILQKKYGYSHKHLPCGISDITTPNKHIEIKIWKSYKEALGQILSYNYCDQKDILEVHLFGEYPEHKKKIAKDIFKNYNINVIDLES